MARRQTREHIIAEADRLFYESGFETTSFADIAAAVAITRGNFYYHFKTKDEILSAVIKKRMADRLKMLEAWETDRTPSERIRAFIEILITNQTKIRAFGCPIGTLATELKKLNHAARGEAVALFDVFRDWLGRQFFDLGFKARSDDLAMHVLMRSQGVASLATAYNDLKFIQREVEDLCRWLDAEVQSLNGK